MTATDLLLLASAMHAGFSLVVTVVVYPALADVGEEAWRRAHASHSRRITWLVVPLYALLLATGAVVLLATATRLEVAAVLANGAAMAVTALRAGPLHGRPTLGPGSADLRSLLIADRVRCAAAVTALVLATLATG